MASTLSAGLKAAAGKRAAPEALEVSLGSKSATVKGGSTVLIGAHFLPEVRRALMLVQAQPENTGRNLKELLGEAINDLCAKYSQPQPYSDEGR